MVHKTFFSLLQVGLGPDYVRFFLNFPILSYVILDSFFGYLIINITNNAIKDITNISIFSIFVILFLPLYSNVLSMMYSNIFLKKKIHVINNLINYLKDTFKNAPIEFHDKYDINDKYDSFTSNIWGYDHIVQLIISLMSSLIKIVTISISLSYQDYKLGLLIILANSILLYIMPKINKKIEDLKKNKINYKEMYGDIYYETVIYEETRVNPKINIIKEDINSSLINIISNYHNREIYYKIGNLVTISIKAIFLFAILCLVYGKNNYILILLLNQGIIFGFVDLYTEFKQTENSNKKHMEELFNMLEFIDKHEKEKDSGRIELIVYDENINATKIKLEDLDYKIIDDTNQVKLNLKSDLLIFDFTNKKNMILIDGRTGSGKTVFTKILSGFTPNDYKLINCDTLEEIGGFSKIKSRILINQKVSEEYTRNGNITMKLNKLYPGLVNIEELNIFLDNFSIKNKFVEDKLTSTFTDKLSGGERQRIVLSSMIWKILKVNPTFIIIDEPEKGIDEETMIKIMDFILEKYNNTIFLITHNETIKSRYKEKFQSIIKYKYFDSYTKIIQEFN